ncbi:hypothetical protein GGI25_005171 [Coemansia spiralis]|uniref:Zn(2)-C6 fungal-type domain-containing protein n=2 Tax=Coemansia TaxID=4863 RepID=A0A9W8KWH0_9FUNG|nr:hypothetical protein EDC05_004738 [Coemansia umbellata]KAJ2620389.1 hypothetical protein GGI26_005031 [Coemansia sp. RSA 1358]KAJ2672289.1 hypothetical protein GGI25_005171 [Coemansia spiralis]
MSESSNPPAAKKRAQVKNACVNCQRACKKCDPGRPCQRCVRYNLAESCVDSQRKPRKKGIKRGPYKKRKREESVERQRPRILGPGAIPILHTSPGDDKSDGSSSDTPLKHSVPETPTQGLTQAFGALSYSGPSGIRLPPIESFDRAQPPTSLAILTDVALGRTTLPVPRDRLRARSPNDTEQQSLDIPRSESHDTSHESGTDSEHVHRLERRLHHTHLEQEHAGSE